MPLFIILVFYKNGAPSSISQKCNKLNLNNYPNQHTYANLLFELGDTLKPPNTEEGKVARDFLFYSISKVLETAGTTILSFMNMAERSCFFISIASGNFFSFIKITS